MLIILAVISVNLLMNGNIIGRAEQSKDIQEESTELERLELIKSVVAIDNKGKVTVDDYIKEAIKEGVTTEDTVEDNGDESKNIVTDNGYNVNIAPDPDNENNVIITIDGKEGSLKPVISKIDTSATKSSITAKAKVRHLNGGTVEYYYRLHGKTPEDSYKKIEGGTNEKATVTGLTNEEHYDIKAVATNTKGTDEKEKTDIIARDFIPVSKITLNKNKYIVGIKDLDKRELKLTATIEPQNATIQDLKWTSSSGSVATVSDDGTITGKALGNTDITVSALDGSNVTAVCSVKINETEKITDPNGNTYMVPGGFEVAEHGWNKITYNYNDSHVPCVQDGIVVRDDQENEFVWIPIGKVKNKDKTESTIKLGRYSDFSADANGNYNPVESEILTLKPYPYGDLIHKFQEYKEYMTKGHDNFWYSSAFNIQSFLNKSEEMCGYYLARFEYGGNGSNDTVSKFRSYPTAYCNQGSLPDKASSSYSQYSAFHSDLVNSYAWDTALIFIQTYSEKNNYAYSNLELSSEYQYAGLSDDMVCNIFDMAGNRDEMTTEWIDYTENYAAHQGFTYRRRGHRYIATTDIAAPVWGWRICAYI